MEVVFGDAFFFIAWLNNQDEAHGEAISAGAKPGRVILTTEYVLLEVADAIAETPRRGIVGTFFQLLGQSRNVEIVEADRKWFDRGLELYSARSDKQWSLTDCISFEVMRSRKLTDALTHDHHFKQAGFRILL